MLHVQLSRDHVTLATWMWMETLCWPWTGENFLLERTTSLLQPTERLSLNSVAAMCV